MLSLQTELTAVDNHFARVKKAISEGSENPEVFRFLDSLRRTHEETLNKVEKLYTSLNVTDVFPEIEGLPLEFVRTLLLARDLKINIRKRAIGSFLEWEKLNQAAGGRDQPLGKSHSMSILRRTNPGILAGTKLHQQTREAISKRTPALKTAIRKFNKYRAEMAKLYDVAWNFPLPDPLPEELSTMREDPSLLTDVWVTRVSSTIPRWLNDPDVRRGIRSVLAKDRCEEERRRLEMEAENMCRSFRIDLAAVELALRLPASTVFD